MNRLAEEAGSPDQANSTQSGPDVVEELSETNGVSAQEAVEKLGQEVQQDQQEQQQEAPQGARPSLLSLLCGRTFGGRA